MSRQAFEALGRTWTDVRHQIPDKIYFRIGEVAELLEVETHVLRYWETEFPQLKPDRTASNQRLYRRQELETFFEIKRLLYDEKFTIAGAQKKLALRLKSREPGGKEKQEELLDYIKNSLAGLKEILSGN